VAKLKYWMIYWITSFKKFEVLSSIILLLELTPCRDVFVLHIRVCVVFVPCRLCITISRIVFFFKLTILYMHIYIYIYILVTLTFNYEEFVWCQNSKLTSSMSCIFVSIFDKGIAFSEILKFLSFCQIFWLFKRIRCQTETFYDILNNRLLKVWSVVKHHPVAEIDPLSWRVCDAYMCRFCSLPFVYYNFHDFFEQIDNSLYAYIYIYILP